MNTVMENHKNQHCPQCGKSRYSKGGVYRNWYDCGTWDVGETGKVKQSLQCRVFELEGAINSVLNQKADNACWRDIYTILAGLVGRKEEFAQMLALLPASVMLGNCVKFICSLKDGTEYQTDNSTRCMDLMEKEIKKLRTENQSLRKGY